MCIENLHIKDFENHKTSLGYRYYPKLLIYELGKPRSNGVPKICPKAQISKALTPGNLENEVTTPKS